MSYRVEVAKTGRAGCQETECKKAGVKIDQGDLRFGIWVEINGNGSWRWKHWGCITGKQLQNVRNYLDPNGTGDYDWDRMDGYDDEDKGSLHDHPELQDKVRRVVTQGFIDPQDWKGDPEMNKLGESGIRTSETKKKMREEKKARGAEDQGLPAPVVQSESPKKKPTSKKRARAKEESDDEEAVEESKPAPKKRASKAKKEEVDADGEPVEVKPKAKRGRKSAVKEEAEDEQNIVEAPEAKPKAKRSAKKAVKEEAVDEEDGVGDAPEAKPKAKRGRKVAVKEEVFVEQNGSEAPETKPKVTAKKSRKKAVKKEKAEVENGLEGKVKGEPAEASSSLSHITPAATDDEAPKFEEDPTTMELDVDLEEKKPKKKSGRVKSGLSARSRRSITASKS